MKVPSQSPLTCQEIRILTIFNTYEGGDRDEGNNIIDTFIKPRYNNFLCVSSTQGAVNPLEREGLVSH